MEENSITNYTIGPNPLEYLEQHQCDQNKFCSITKRENQWYLDFRKKITECPFCGFSLLRYCKWCKKETNSRWNMNGMRVIGDVTGDVICSDCIEKAAKKLLDSRTNGQK